MLRLRRPLPERLGQRRLLQRMVLAREMAASVMECYARSITYAILIAPWQRWRQRRRQARECAICVRLAGVAAARDRVWQQKTTAKGGAA